MFTNVDNLFAIAFLVVTVLAIPAMLTATHLLHNVEYPHVLRSNQLGFTPILILFVLMLVMTGVFFSLAMPRSAISLLILTTSTSVLLQRHSNVATACLRRLGY